MNPVLGAALSQSKNCHPEEAESLAKASGSQRRISVLRGRRNKNRVPHFSRSVREVGQSATKTTTTASSPD
jgi:hypothetical protein